MERNLGNPTQFHVLVPDRASVWRALGAIFRLELVDPDGIAMEDITDLLDIVRFCRAHGEEPEVPVQSNGRISLEVLASLADCTAGICERVSPAELFADLAAVPDFSIVFDYRTKDTLDQETIGHLCQIAASEFTRRYVNRVAVDPDNTGISHGCEVELIDPFDLKTADARLAKIVRQHLENPEAFIQDREHLSSFTSR
jgi:hypothetical protein